MRWKKKLCNRKLNYNIPKHIFAANFLINKGWIPNTKTLLLEYDILKSLSICFKKLNKSSIIHFLSQCSYSAFCAQCFPEWMRAWPGPWRLGEERAPQWEGLMRPAVEGGTESSEEVVTAFGWGMEFPGKLQGDDNWGLTAESFREFEAGWGRQLSCMSGGPGVEKRLCVWRMGGSLQDWRWAPLKGGEEGVARLWKTLLVTS